MSKEHTETIGSNEKNRIPNGLPGRKASLEDPTASVSTFNSILDAYEVSSSPPTSRETTYKADAKQKDATNRPKRGFCFFKKTRKLTVPPTDSGPSSTFVKKTSRQMSLHHDTPAAQQDAWLHLSVKTIEHRKIGNDFNTEKNGSSGCLNTGMLYRPSLRGGCIESWHAKDDEYVMDEFDFNEVASASMSANPSFSSNDSDYSGSSGISDLPHIHLGGCGTTDLFLIDVLPKIPSNIDDDDDDDDVQINKASSETALKKSWPTWKPTKITLRFKR